MINLLLVYDQMNTTTEVNLSGAKGIFDDGEHTVRIIQSKAITQDDLNWCDACFANRPSSVYMLRISRALRKSGRRFISLFDDDLLCLPKGNSARWKKNYVLRCLKGSDIVITPNPLLAKLYNSIVSAPKYVILNTHVPEVEIKPVSKAEKVIKIVYAAGLDHTGLFEKYIIPSMDELVERYPSRIEMTLIGIRPNLSKVRQTGWIHQMDTMPYEQYKGYMRSHHFDVGLAPLEDELFSNRKYFNKFFEYSKNGIVGLYSNCLPYTLVIKDGENGCLVDNSVEAWRRALCNAVEQIDTIKEIAHAAQRQLRTEFSISAVRKVIHTEVDGELIGRHYSSRVRYSRPIVPGALFEARTRWHQLTAHIYGEGIIMAVKRAWARMKN